MSKVPEDKGGLTQQQTKECSCGYAQWAASLERYPTASLSTRISAEDHKGGGVTQANSASATYFRDPAAASPSLQSTTSFKDSGHVNSSSVNPSVSFQRERSLKNSSRCGDVQLPKSPSGSVSPPFQGECSIKDSRGREDVQQQPAKFPSSNGAHESVQRGSSVRDNGRFGDFQQAQSPSGTASPALKGERGLRESRRTRDGQQPVSPRTGASPSYQGESSFRDSRGSGDVQQAKSPSVIVSPYCQGECILRESKRRADVQQQQPNFVSANPSPSSQRERSLRDRRIGDAQQEPKSPLVNASPALGRARGLKDSIRNGDEQQSKSASVGSSSRATPVAASPHIKRWGSLEENVKSGGFQANAASLTSPSGATRTASSSSCTSLKSKLAAGQKLYGALLVSFSTVVAEILGWAGYDFVVVDLDQLCPGDTLAALPVLQALESTGTPAIFRLPGGDPVLVSKALDMGPAGLMFSMIENEEAARNAVASCRYPPRGMRRASRHMVSRASRYGLDVSYMDHCEEDLFVMCQVETMEALEKVMQIAGVDGVDGIHMGGLEFGASLGDPYLDFNTRLLILHAEEKVLSRQRKIFLAGLATSENSPQSLFKRGYHLVSGAVDVALLRDAALADLRRNKPSEYVKPSV